MLDLMRLVTFQTEEGSKPQAGIVSGDRVIGLGKDMLPFARTVFQIYWGEDKDISQDAVLAEVCQRCGIDSKTFFAGIAEQPIKDQLKANTDEVMGRGGFGSPTIFLDKTDMYFGNDRLPLIRDALARRRASAA